MIEIDDHELDEYERELIKTRNEIDQLFERALKQLAARVLRDVIKSTPVSDGQLDENGLTIRTGGTLRRGWTAKSEEDAEGGASRSIEDWESSVRVKRVGNYYEIQIVNPVSYASYVEYGHRQTPGRYVPAIGKRLKKSWVEGQFMLTNSVNAVKANHLPQIELEIHKFIEEHIKYVE